MTVPFEHPLPVGTTVHVKSEHFPQECEAVILEAIPEVDEFPNAWNYRIRVVSGEAPPEKEFVCDFEVHPLT